ncbi:MAG: hypothetical protein U9R39_06620 [Campylobacterota bacterium]|nr:hypothetical protein [Campylobacterota bacterium]
MNKTLILISKTPIVIKIFTLVCKKLSIKLEVLKEAQIDHKVDITIVDKDLIDDRFNILKTYSKVIGAISNKELSFEMANDFLIPLPFLPSTLEKILDEQLQAIRKKENSKTYISTVQAPHTEDEIEEIPQYNNEELEPAIDYLENLADGIAQNVKVEQDDSIVSVSSMENQGGILDTDELSKIEDIFNIDAKTSEHNQKEFTKDDEDEQWHDLSSIIDDAINEVNTTANIYDRLDNKPIKVLLNNYSLTELTPLLNMLDQDIINTLTDGYEVTVQLKLGKTNE